MSDKQKLKKLIEYMKPRPLMYLGNSFYSGMVSYINGFAAACDEDILGNFRKWLLETRFKSKESNFSWCGLVLILAFPHKKKCYIHDSDLSEEENLYAMQIAFSLLLEFLENEKTSKINSETVLLKKDDKYVSRDLSGGSSANDWLELAKSNIAINNYGEALFPLKMAAKQFEQVHDMDSANKARALLKDARAFLRHK